MSIRSRRWALIAGVVVVLSGLGLWLRSDSSEHRWAAIESALQRQGWSEAEPRLQAWLRRSPDDGKAWLRLGGVLGFERREAESLEAFEHIKPSDPEWLSAQLQIAEIWLNRRQLTRAEGVLRAASDRVLWAVEPRRRLVYVLTLLQRHDEARTTLWELFRLTHDPRQLATLVGLVSTEADSRDLARELDDFVKVVPDDPWIRRAWGVMLNRIGKKAEALPYLETAAARFENDPIGRLALADCLVERGDLGAAEKTLGTKPTRPDDLARWWLLRGEILAARGKTDEAIACWRSSSEAAPFDRSVLYRLGQALVRYGKPDEAKPYLDQVEILRVREVNLINALDRLVRGERTQQTFEQLAVLCRDAGRLTEARSWFEEVVRLDPTNSQAQIALARLGSATEVPAPVPRLRTESAAPSVAVAAAPGDSTTPVRFEDVAKRAGLDFQYDCASRGDMFLGDTMGGGVGLIDFDGDGWLDVYLVNGCPLPYDRKAPPRPNKLFRNRRDGTFEDVTARAGVGGRGYGMGCAVGDIDNDGRDDLFVTGLGSTVLYRNRGDGTFEDVTERAGVGSAFWTTAAGFGDLDGDGDLDLVAVTYVEADPVKASTCLDANGKPIHCPPGRFPPQPDLLFRNNGDGTFTELGRNAGLHIPGGDGLGLAIADLDSDGKLDLFVANDASPNFYFRNLGGLKFEEIGTQAGIAYDGNGRATASMGVVAEDLDGDGRIDLFHTNYINEPSTLLHNLGGCMFEDVTARAGLDSTGRAFTGFGTVALDADNDGLLDLFVANGHVDDRPWINHPMAQLPHFFHGRSPGRFRLAPPSVSPYFARPVVGRGAAVGDLDNDGRLDMVVVHRDQRVSLLHNESTVGHWLGLRLKGTRSGKTPVGARVTCRIGKWTAVRWQTSGTSYLSSSDPRLWFGLGTDRTVDQLEVRWPSGTVQSWQNLEADRILDLVEGQNPAPAAPR
jgi:tetratricopeptide (TPR) repeat protein